MRTQWGTKGRFSASKSFVTGSKALISSLLLCCLPGFSQEQKIPVSEQPDDRVNFPSNFQVEGGANLFIFGDYLFWTAQENGLYYAQTGGGTGTDDVPPNGSINFDGHLKKVDPEWENGLRVGAGVNFPKEGYDLLLAWTWVSSSAHDSVSSALGNILPLWAHPDFEFLPGAFTAEGKWDFDLNIGDLEWGRSSWFGGHFSLRPFFGLRGLWLDQDLKNTYLYNTEIPPFITGRMHLESDFRGGGLRAGTDARFEMPYGFAIYGIASGSLLYGRFHANMHFHEDEFTIAETKDHFWKGISSLQLALGLGWDSHFCRDHCHIEFHVGWEQNIWFGANQMNHYLNGFRDGSYFKENSNLTLQGLVAGGRFDF